MWSVSGCSLKIKNVNGVRGKVFEDTLGWNLPRERGVNESGQRKYGMEFLILCPKLRDYLN